MNAEENKQIEQVDLNKLNGVEVTSEPHDFGEVVTLKVTNAEGEKAVGKPIGNYITVYSPHLRLATLDERLEIAQTVSEHLSRLITVGDLDHVMVVGLGNPDIETDSLGAKAAKKVLVTNHLVDEITQQGGVVRPVSAFTPGVMGCNGIETRAIVKGVCDRAKPALVIVIDALASMTVERLNSTIQIADTGLTPGAGMSSGEKKGAIDEALLGVPVIGIGVPVVIDVVTLVNDIIGLTMPPKMRNGSDYIAKLLATRDDIGKRGRKSMREMLRDECGLTFVAPKEVADITETLADVISSAINLSLHKDMTPEHIRQYTI